MTLEREALVRRLYDSAFEAATVRELVAEDLAYHLPDGSLGGRRELEAGAEAMRKGFPDLAFSITDLKVDGDRVEVRWRARGTHRGKFVGIAPTGRTIEMSGRHVERVVAGRIVERWGESDHKSLMAQLRGG